MPKKRDMKKDWFKHHREDKMKNEKCHYHHFCKGGAVYFLGFIGAAVYYLQQSTTFWDGVIGLLKALVWPAFLVYKLLGF